MVPQPSLSDKELLKKSSAGSGVFSFLRAFTQHWGTIMSGALSVPFTALLLFVEARYGKVLFGILAFLSFVYTAYRIWKYERQTLITKQIELDQERQRHLREPTGEPMPHLTFKNAYTGNDHRIGDGHDFATIVFKNTGQVATHNLSAHAIYYDSEDQFVGEIKGCTWASPEWDVTTVRVLEPGITAEFTLVHKVMFIHPIAYFLAEGDGEQIRLHDVGNVFRIHVTVMANNAQMLLTEQWFKLMLAPFQVERLPYGD